MHFRPRPPASSLTIAAVTAVFLWASSNIYWGKEHYRTVIQSDAIGYYAYLPAVFIYHDLNFGFFEAMDREKYYNPDLFYEYRIRTPGGVIDKYYCGTSIAQLPFFLAAHGLTGLTGGDADGYSRLYPIFIGIAALFYMALGLFFLDRLLRLYAILDRDRAITLAAIALGTHMVYYAVVAPGMSHVYSFAFCTLFLWQGKLLVTDPRPGRIIALGALLGFIALIRPVNVLVVCALPFLAGNAAALRTAVGRILQRWPAIVLGVIAAGAICSVQSILYWLATGSFFIYSYEEEWFNWTDPHIIDILFSYRKGLFIYTPMLLLAVIFGLYFLWRQDRYAVATWLGMFAILTYVFSAWWSWWYGGGFSGRPYLEYLGLFAILLAIALKHLTIRPARIVAITALTLCSVLCQIQTLQARYYQIHYENMDREKYWDVFLRVDRIG